MTITTKKQIAHAAGVKAAKEQKPSAPYMCDTYRSLIEGMAVGTGAAEIGQAWNKGYNSTLGKMMMDL